MLRWAFDILKASNPAIAVENKSVGEWETFRTIDTFYHPLRTAGALLQPLRW